MLAYKKEDKPWDWIFGKFPGRTQLAVRTRWNMIRPKVAWARLLELVGCQCGESVAGGFNEDAARRALAFYTGSWPRYVRTQSSCPHSDRVALRQHYQNSISCRTQQRQGKFSSTWSMSSPPGSLKINCESHSVLCYLLSLKVISFVMSVLFWKS